MLPHITAPHHSLPRITARHASHRMVRETAWRQQRFKVLTCSGGTAWRAWWRVQAAESRRCLPRAARVCVVLALIRPPDSTPPQADYLVLDRLINRQDQSRKNAGKEVATSACLLPAKRLDYLSKRDSTCSCRGDASSQAPCAACASAHTDPGLVWTPQRQHIQAARRQWPRTSS